MLGKVALRNIRRSVKDYAIYFVTLLMAVTLFYACLLYTSDAADEL